MLRVCDIKGREQPHIRFRGFGEKEENLEKRRTKRREEFVEPCNHQSKVRVGLIFSNLRLYNSEIEFSM